MNFESGLKSLPLGSIHLNDKFWSPYVRLVKDVILPYQWEILNDRIPEAKPGHCIHNFRIAAGEEKGSFEGVVFQDTDLAKWLEAVSYILAQYEDKELERLADEAVSLIGKAQCEDGYINTYFTIKEPELRWTNLQEGHELYTAGHLIEAAVAYCEATGKDSFLKTAERFAKLICDVFGPGKEQNHGYPGHQEIELALVKLYRITGNKKYLNTAKYFIDRRGVGENYFLWEEGQQRRKRIFAEFSRYDPCYSQSHLPVREQKTAEGHAVRAVYMYCAMADLAYEFRDESLFKACEIVWKNIVTKRMYITGGIGSSGILERFTTDYDLPNDCNYAETCASIGLALFGKRMAQITKDGAYMEIVEKELYNSILSGISMDGKSFFYVNPLEVWPDACMDRTSREHVKAVRQKWFGVACCPPNIARTLASLGQYIYFLEDACLYVNLYIANETNVKVNGVPYHVKMESGFPWQGSISFSIDGTGGKEAGFAFRIPGYGGDFQIYNSKNEIEKYEVHKGYAVIKGVFVEETWRIRFSMKAEFVRGNPQIRADSGKAAVMKGPLVYCLEEADNGSNLSALYVDTRGGIQEIYDRDLLGGVIKLRCKGKKISGSEWKEEELYHSRPLRLQDTALQAVPYYCWGNREKGEMLVWMKEIISER